MLEHCTRWVLEWCEAHPEIPCIDVSQNDAYPGSSGACECEACAAVVLEEGSQHGPILRFANAIAAAVTARFPGRTIETIAYQHTLATPKVTRPRDDVIVRLCQHACYFHGIDCPSLGAESVRSGVSAALGGLALVMIFLLVYYRLSGFNAIASIVVNLIILLGLMSYLGATMTLPGIAGFILTIGMGVDSNVLIFERIKEELAASRGVKQAIAAGFDRVFLTILDTHIASLIAAAFLFQFGTGPIRGFATTLSIRLLSNVFTSVFVSRTLFELVLSRRRASTLSI